MKAGLASGDITPSGPVWMDGMIRAHPSTGVHDRVFAKALALSGGAHPSDAFVIVSFDLCSLSAPAGLTIRALAEARTGIPRDRIILAAKHNHSGPSTRDVNNARPGAYLETLTQKTVALIAKAVAAMTPAAIGCGSGQEKTISHYRRLLADDGRVVMNWEPWPAERIVRPLGVVDAELGVLKIISADASGRLLGLLFNHAGHPNVMSGDNYLISSDYPGRAEALLEQEHGGTALFVNGAQGTMDIDGLKDRDWAGVERVGRALAAAVSSTLKTVTPCPDPRLRSAVQRYAVPARKVSEQQQAWAHDIIRQTGDTLKPLADGVGDDYKAELLLRLWKVQHKDIPMEQICLGIDDCAFLTFPGELFTEIGMRIKAASPFRHTYILGLANGSIGYVPTRQAIREGGYEPDVRCVDDGAEDIVVEQSLALLRRVRGL